MNNLEETDRKDLILRKKGMTRNLRRHKNNCKMKFACTIQRSIDTWNGLKKEVIMVKNINQLIEKLDKCRFGDRTTGV